jgi:hypothetical protein
MYQFTDVEKVLEIIIENQTKKTTKKTYLI